MKKSFQLSVGSGLSVVAVYLTYQHLKSLDPTTPLTSPPSMTLKGTAVKGAVIAGVNSQGQNLTLKIQDVEPDPKDREGDVYLYTVVYQNLTTSQWQNLCQSDQDGVAKAIPLIGRWDTTGNYINDKIITFACTKDALGKCVRWGYKPWKTFQGKSLRDLHQACTRMVRADYCGTGVSYTQENTQIDFYDRLGIQKRVNKSEMIFEAAWKPDGAVAISRTRFPETLAQIQSECPRRIKPFQDKYAAGRDTFISLSLLQKYAPEAVIFNDSFVHPLTKP